jgi:hypothetical protein
MAALAAISLSRRRAASRSPRKGFGLFVILILLPKAALGNLRAPRRLGMLKAPQPHQFIKLPAPNRVELLGLLVVFQIREKPPPDVSFDRGNLFAAIVKPFRP